MGSNWPHMQVKIPEYCWSLALQAMFLQASHPFSRSYAASKPLSGMRIPMTCPESIMKCAPMFQCSVNQCRSQHPQFHHEFSQWIHRVFSQKMHPKPTRDPRHARCVGGWQCPPSSAGPRCSMSHPPCRPCCSHWVSGRWLLLGCWDGLKDGNYRGEVGFRCLGWFLDGRWCVSCGIGGVRHFTWIHIQSISNPYVYGFSILFHLCFLLLVLGAA